MPSLSPRMPPAPVIATKTPAAVASGGPLGSTLEMPARPAHPQAPPAQTTARPLANARPPSLIPAPSPLASSHNVSSRDEAIAESAQLSPNARSVFVGNPNANANRHANANANAPPNFDVVFPAERIARLDDFVRLQLASRSVTFLRLLAAQGISPQQYAALVARLNAAMQADPRLHAEYMRRLRLAQCRALPPAAPQR